MNHSRPIVSSVHSAALSGFHGTPIIIETDSSAGLPLLQIVGMGNKSVNEARQRVRSAIRHSSLEFPTRKLTVNLAPADLPKDGTHFDLAIAISILTASGQLRPSEVANKLFVGELALNGELRPVRGAVLIAEAARGFNVEALFIPAENAHQAQLVEGITIVPVHSLREAFQILKGTVAASSVRIANTQVEPVMTSEFDAISGHEQAKRALVIAAAGRHNLLLNGPPGVGKTLLARTLPTLLPSLSHNEILEVTKLHSLSSGGDGSICRTPPFRSPHHSITQRALLGGGARTRPGELSLAHKGVLFLDELSEYPRNILESLRQPLEDRVVHLSRLHEKISYPADAMLVATTNPCKCGFYGDATRSCSCSPASLQSYQSKLSGALLDRIDLQCVVVRSSQEYIFDSKSLRKNQQYKVLLNINSARKAQAIRYNRSDFYNAYASYFQTKKLFHTTPAANSLLKTASTQMGLSTRGSLKTLRVARTIADLAGSTELTEVHIAEALQFRGSG